MERKYDTVTTCFIILMGAIMLSLSVEHPQDGSLAAWNVLTGVVLGWGLHRM